MRYINIFIFFIFLLLTVHTKAQAQLQEARPSAKFVIAGDVKEADMRAEILRAYLVRFNSPLAAHSQYIVSEADTYNIDWRFLVAISGVESTFANAYPHDTYNAWGWGIYGDNMHYFSSWDDAIHTITKELRERYMDTWNAKDVYAIGSFYAASPTWASRVTFFMDQIDTFGKDYKNQTLSISL